jgi:signal transduction histidine kinase
VSEELETAYQESAQITATFDALLRIAQIKGGARRANFAPVDLKALCETLLEIYVDVAEDAGMQLWAELPEHPLPCLQGDRELLLQMLANLIENAVRYCPPGTGIRLTIEVDNNRLRLLVADNGPGIPVAEREKVFQHLYRLDKSRSDAQGTGLGLSLVKAVAELHEGTVEIRDNQPGVLVVLSFEKYLRPKQNNAQ